MYRRVSEEKHITSPDSLSSDLLGYSFLIVLTSRVKLIVPGRPPLKSIR